MADVMESLTLQRAEFDALDVLTERWRVLRQVAVVDDDYPCERQRFECALFDFLRACQANGRRMFPDQLRFEALREATAKRQVEWDKDGGVTLLYRATELGGEVGEALNVVKKIERERLGIRGSRATVADLAAELADVVICADLLAMAEGIDLGESVRAKFNATSEKVGLSTRLA